MEGRQQTACREHPDESGVEVYLCVGETLDRSREGLGVRLDLYGDELVGVRHQSRNYRKIPMGW